MFENLIELAQPEIVRHKGDGRPKIGKKYLTRASSSFDPQSLAPCVNFSFNSAGSSLFSVLTSSNLPDPANRLTSRLGIVLDGELLSAPAIGQQRISANCRFELPSNSASEAKAVKLR